LVTRTKGRSKRGERQKEAQKIGKSWGGGFLFQAIGKKLIENLTEEGKAKKGYSTKDDRKKKKRSPLKRRNWEFGSGGEESKGG